MVSVDDDLTFPILVPPKNTPILVLSSGVCPNMVASVPSASQLTDPRWAPAEYSALVGDVLGTGSGSILLAPTSATGTNSFSLVRNAADGTYSVLQSFAVANFGIGSGSTISMENTNSDSRSDLVVRNGLNVVAVFTAGPDGRFTGGISDLIALTTVVWNNFTKTLKSSQPTNALQLVSSSTRPLFDSVISAPGADTVHFANSIVRFDVLNISTPGIVKACIVTNDDGTPTLYYVLFEQDTDGYWKIYSL
jgi:hypothetical protein